MLVKHLSTSKITILSMAARTVVKTQICTINQKRQNSVRTA